MQMRAEIRGVGLFGGRAFECMKQLEPGQRLILSREPANRRDRNAIIVSEITGQPVGYVARKVAAVVAPGIDSGEEFWMSAVLEASYLVRRAGRWRITWPVAILWRQTLEDRALLWRQQRVLATPRQREWLADDFDGLSGIVKEEVETSEWEDWPNS